MVAISGWAATAHAQNVASDTCAELAGNQWTVGGCPVITLPDDFSAENIPCPCGTPNNDAFVWFTPTSDDSTTIGLVTNDTVDVAFQVFTGGCASLTQVACRNHYGLGYVEDTTIYTSIGTHYLVRVETMGAYRELGYGQLCIQPTPPAPVNGDPCSAINLPVTDSCNAVAAGTNISSITTTAIANPCPNASILGSSGDVWFKAVVPAGQDHVIIDTQSAVDMDGAMSIYASPGGCADYSNFIFLGCDDDDSSTGHEMPGLYLNTDTLAGDTLYIRFWAFYGAENDFRICASYDITTLPVEFIAFQVQAHDGVVEVTWSTATEQNSDHFIVERSMDNSVFQAIGQLPAAGESSNQHDYSYTDAAPPSGMVYYRVREVDHNGSSMLTATTVAFAEVASDAPLLYPDPALDRLNVAYTAERDGPTQIAVTDALGRSLIVQEEDGQHGRRAAQVDLHALVPGYYSVRITLPSGEVLRAGGFIKR